MCLLYNNLSLGKVTVTNWVKAYDFCPKRQLIFSTELLLVGWFRSIISMSPSTNMTSIANVYRAKFRTWRYDTVILSCLFCDELNWKMRAWGMHLDSQLTNKGEYTHCCDFDDTVRVACHLRSKRKAENDNWVASVKYLRFQLYLKIPWSFPVLLGTNSLNSCSVLNIRYLG